jgi:hypothetical protein
MPQPNCPVCHSFDYRLAFKTTVLGKHKASYYSCHNCGFLNARQPTWLEEAYANDNAVVSADTGLLKRNTRVTEQLSVLLHFGLQLKSYDKCVDMAGGYGLLTRSMRDLGFDFWWQDLYCTNVIAKGFESNAGTKYKVATAFEVLEHVANPVTYVQDLFSSTGADVFVFSTELFSGRPPNQEWWYYVFETGQHISFYQEHTLHVIANTLGLQYRSYAGLHVFAKQSQWLPPHWLYKLLVGRGWVRSKLARKVAKLRKSFTTSDHRQMLANGAK